MERALQAVRTRPGPISGDPGSGGVEASGQVAIGNGLGSGSRHAEAVSKTQTLSCGVKKIQIHHLHGSECTTGSFTFQAEKAGNAP